MNLLDIFHFLVPVLGFVAIVLIASMIWAVRQIKSFFDEQYVTRDVCLECQKEAKNELRIEFNNKTSEILNTIKEIKEDAKAREKTLDNIHTKVDLILEGKIKMGE